MSVRTALVIVSHSDLLARGVVEVASQMAPDVHLGAAGGTDSGIGTSFDRIEEALNAALDSVGGADGGGVVVLTDLGSATLTAESVIEFANDPDMIALVDAPLVEGAVAAAVRAQLGDSLDEVAQAARGAGLRFGEGGVPGATPSGVIDEGGAVDVVTGEARVADPTGLHARPAAMFARLAGSFECEVTINGADAGSVLEVMGLGIRQGEVVHLEARGPQAQEAIAALIAQLEEVPE